MNLSRSVVCSAIALLLSLAVLTSANAADETRTKLRDKPADVQGFTETQDYPRVRDAAELRSVVVISTPELIKIQVRVARVLPQRHGVIQGVDIRIGAAGRRGTFRSGEWGYNGRKVEGSMIYGHPRRLVECDGVTGAVNRTKDTYTVAIPATCISDRRVHLKVSSSTLVKQPNGYVTAGTDDVAAPIRLLMP